MKTFTRLFVLLIALSACQREDSVSAGDGSLTGQFRVEADPLRCALPTTQSLLITRTGSRYRFTYDRFGQGAYQLNDITALTVSATAFDLLLDGQKIGQYAFEELRSIGGTRKTWVLMIRHEPGEQQGLEFMGVKN